MADSPATGLRRTLLALEMTLAYRGRFPRRKVWAFYWRQAGRYPLVSRWLREASRG